MPCLFSFGCLLVVFVVGFFFFRFRLVCYLMCLLFCWLLCFDCFFVNCCFVLIWILRFIWWFVWFCVFWLWFVLRLWMFAVFVLIFLFICVRLVVDMFVCFGLFLILCELCLIGILLCFMFLRFSLDWFMVDFISFNCLLFKMGTGLVALVLLILNGF